MTVRAVHSGLQPTVPQGSKRMRRSSLPDKARHCERHLSRAVLLLKVVGQISRR